MAIDIPTVADVSDPQDGDLVIIVYNTGNSWSVKTKTWAQLRNLLGGGNGLPAGATNDDVLIYETDAGNHWDKIRADNLGAGAVTSVKVANGVITQEKLGSDFAVLPAGISTHLFKPSSEINTVTFQATGITVPGSKDILIVKPLIGAGSASYIADTQVRLSEIRNKTRASAGDSVSAANALFYTNGPAISLGMTASDELLYSTARDADATTPTSSAKAGALMSLL